MFTPGRWAAAFINTAGGADNAEEELEAFKALSLWVKKLRNTAAVFGSSTAKRLTEAVRRAAVKTGSGSTPAVEKAACFTALLVRKNLFHHIDAVIAGIEQELRKRRGIAPVLIESVHPVDGGLEARLAAAIKRRAGVNDVCIEKRLNPGLIGGFRVRMGDNVIDASVRRQLQEMAANLALGFDWADPADGGK
jgi:F-type H+-transporting ATPase subunit delta